MLEVEELVAAYGPVRAVDGVSLSVPAGSITAVLGANGAGKSSLLRAVSGIVRPRSGRVRFQGEDITRQGAEDIVRRGLAHVPEGGGVIAELRLPPRPLRREGPLALALGEPALRLAAPPHGFGLRALALHDRRCSGLRLDEGTVALADGRGGAGRRVRHGGVELPRASE